MSADLFEAFVGSRGVKAVPKSPVQKHTSELLVQPDNLSYSQDTWQPWPNNTRPESQWPLERQSDDLWETDQNGRDVLFDASQLDTDSACLNADDDFGDFEEVPTKQSNDREPQIGALSEKVDLLDLDTVDTAPGNLAEIKRNQSESWQSLKKHSGTSSNSTRSVAKDLIATPLAEQEDEWGEFETMQTSDTLTGPSNVHQTPPPSLSGVRVSQKRLQQASAKIKQESTTVPDLSNDNPESSKSDGFEEEPWDEFEDNEAATVTAASKVTKPLPITSLTHPVLATDEVERSRPTNVPPPAVLLTWLPKVFSRLASQSRQQNAGPQCGIAALQAYRVSARIIAGRAARWKRDTMLAQSMRIGAAGRSGGMKLTTLDKGESRKEDQAAEDAIASWTQFSHILSAAITKAKTQKPPMALSLKLTARTATGLDVVSASHVCATCGLRRNERVIGIDVSVSDTFGEFWIEHWGHKDCADTWYRFNELLDRR